MVFRILFLIPPHCFQPRTIALRLAIFESYVFVAIHVEIVSLESLASPTSQGLSGGLSAFVDRRCCVVHRLLQKG